LLQLVFEETLNRLIKLTQTVLLDSVHNMLLFPSALK
jgi:hypothetical protein